MELHGRRLRCHALRHRRPCSVSPIPTTFNCTGPIAGSHRTTYTAFRIQCSMLSGFAFQGRELCVFRSRVCEGDWEVWKAQEMAKSALVLVVAAVVILMASVEKTEGAVACNDVTNELLACASFIVGTGPAPTAACCSGVQRLNSQAKTVADRQGVCGCLKSAASSYGVNFNKAAQLPSKCGVSLNVPISPTVDCSKVH